MWIGEVAIKVWIRGASAPCNASAARSMSAGRVRARLHTRLSRTASAMLLTAAKSPGLEVAKPASMTSTRSFSSALATRSFSSRVMAAPGLCSPSRRVVSKMINWSLVPMAISSWIGLRSGDRDSMNRPAAAGYRKSEKCNDRSAAPQGSSGSSRRTHRAARGPRAGRKCCSVAESATCRRVVRTMAAFKQISCKLPTPIDCHCGEHIFGRGC